MKKIKLMLVAFFALLSSTMAFAQGESATTIFRYSYTADGKATINGFVAGYATADMATVTITPTVLSTDGSKTYKVTGIASKAFEKNANIKKVIITSTDVTEINDAFSGCSNLTEIDLSAATGVTTITAGAFVGTKLAKLDLSKTKITTVPALFGTSFYKREAKDAVLWKDTEGEAIATHNAGLADAVTAAGAVTGDQAKAYNKTLTGAKKAGDKITDAVFVAKYNASLNPLEGGIELTGDQATAVNEASAADAEWTNTTYVEGSVLKKADAEKYNATLGLIAVNDNFTATTAAAYNATLTGAITTDWNFVTTEAAASTDEKKIWTETYNRAAVATYAYVGGEKEAAITAVDPIAYATLTEVSLPETWTTIDMNAFANCSALATINFGTPKSTITAHTIGQYAFLGTALTALDFSKLKITGALTANLLIDGVNVTTNATLKTVTLNKTISNLNGNFANCTALTTIDLTYVTTLNADEFVGAGLTAITIPTGIATIPARAFKDCKALATVTFAKPAEGEVYTFTSIGEEAFANTAITAFTVPSVMDYKTANGVVAKAFADCVKLTSFTYKPTISTGTVQKVVNDKAFLGCEDGIKFYTVKEYAEAAAPGANKVAPTHAEFSYETSPAAPEEEEAKVLTAVKFKNGNNKYFVKYNSMTENIKIAKTDGKVYAAYNADDDATIVMQQFKTNGGYYHIAAGDNVIIITDLEKVPYETSTVVGGSTFTGAGAIETPGKGSSWLKSAADASRENMLNYITTEGGVKRSVLEDALPGPGYYIFAWSNTTSATGWLKITSGSSFPQKTLYIYAKPTEAAASARVIWLDENGFVEDETTSINTIQNVEEAGDATIYNVAGQKVNASYRGLVIKNGKKFMK